MKKQKNAPQILPREEWPYEVPENWVWTVAKNTVNLYRGVSYKKNDAHTDKHSNDYLILRGGNISEGKIDTFADNIYVNKDLVQENQLVKNNDIVIVASTGSKTVIGRSGISYNDYTDVAFGAFLILLRPKEMLCKPYIAYFYQSLYYRESIRNLAAGVNINNIRANHILEMPVPLPPLPEQQRIVARIESLFSKLDAAAEKIRSALDAFPTRKAALLHKAFTGELTKKWREEHGVRMDSWKSLTLNEVADYKKGPFGSSITKAMFVPQGNNTYKVYEQGNAIRKTLDYGHYYINEQKYNELKGFAIQAGDIIISCAGTIGEVYKLPENCEAGVINQALMRVRLYPHIEEQFFIYYFGEVIKGDVVTKSNGTAIQNIPPFKVMKAMNIFLPTLPEQQEIVRILDAIFEREQTAKETAERLLEQIALTKKSILARAFRGLLGTNDPKEESAEGWLEEKNL